MRRERKGARVAYAIRVVVSIMAEQDAKSSHETIEISEWDGPGGPGPGAAGQTKRKNIPIVIILQGETNGKKFLVEKSQLLIGRTPDADIVLADYEVSRRHSVIEYENIDKPDEPPRCFVRDEESKNGTFVNGERVTSHQLMDKDIVSIGSVVLGFYLKDEMEVQFDSELYSMATFDALTGVYNKHFFQRELQRALTRAAKNDLTLSLVFCDLDHFKNVNDTHGHLAGDFILREIGQILRDNLREYDICARYGGEEFAIILPSASVREAKPVAERLRTSIENRTFDYQGTIIPMTISIGVATIGDTPRSGDEMLEAADKALYRAKERGRNRVVLEDEL